MASAKDVGFVFRPSLVALVVLCLSTGCVDATQRLAPIPETPAPTPPGPAISSELIYIAHADGSDPVRLIPGSRPAWSPDGRRIAFHRNGEVRVVNADGSNDVRLSQGRSPTWSPDGARIVFTSSEGISVMNVDGSSVTTLIRHDFRGDNYEPWDMGVDKATWSPDGALIAFEHLGDGDMLPAQIYVMSSHGSGVHRLNNFPEGRWYAESDPSWSPDGLRVMHWSWGYGIGETARNGGVPNGIYFGINAVAYGAKPLWSPDGRSIAFTTGRHLPGWAKIWTMSGTGTGAKVLIRDGYDAAWSPDGARIAFVSTRGQ